MRDLQSHDYHNVFTEGIISLTPTDLYSPERALNKAFGHLE